MAAGRPRQYELDEADVENIRQLKAYRKKIREELKWLTNAEIGKKFEVPASVIKNV